MSWFSRIIRTWQSSGTKEKISLFFNVGGFIMAFIGFYESISKETLLIIISSMFFLSSIFAILQNISVRNEREEAKQALVKEKDKASVALNLVYAQKDQEIKNLKKDIERACTDTELKVIAEKDNADKKINERRIQSEKEISEWADRCEKLNDALGLYIEKERLEFRLKVQQKDSNSAPQNVIKTVEARMCISPTFPGETRFNEMNQTLKEFKKNKKI